MPAVSTAEFRGRALDNQDARAGFSRAQRGAQSGVASAYDQDIDCQTYRLHTYRFRGDRRKSRIKRMTRCSRSPRAVR